MAISKVIPISGGKILSGNFSVLERLGDFVDSIESHIEDSLRDTAQYAQDDLRESALSHPKWKKYANNLTVHLKDGEIVYGMSGTDEQIQAMSELEYGSQSGDPQPLLRLKAHRYDKARVEHMKVKV